MMSSLLATVVASSLFTSSLAAVVERPLRPRAPSAAQIRAATPAERAVAPSDGYMFGDLPVAGPLAEQLRGSGFEKPTPIQAAAMMPIVRGQHALVHAETGSGKTLAYLLPLLSRCHASKPSQVLVVVPSRELAVQIGAVVERLWPWHGTQRAFLLTEGAPAAELHARLERAACPVIVATPKPLLAVVTHLAGTPKLYSRRALEVAGGPLARLAAGLRAVVLDEADALLLSREMAMSGGPQRKSYKQLAGRGGGDVKAPERFTRPAARALQGLLTARRTSFGGGGGGGAAGGRRRGPKPLQVVACSATVTYRLQQEVERLVPPDASKKGKPGALALLAPHAAGKEGDARKRRTGERGRAAVGVPRAIQHCWLPVGDSSYLDGGDRKPAAIAAAVRALRPRASLLFLPDDAPFRATLAALRAEDGVDAHAVHELMGLDADAHSSGGYDALEAALRRDGGGGAAGEEAAEGGESEEGGDSDSLLLVSTWGASRGLDLGAVDVVLLYELPRSADEYLHLAGRTGRNGRAGRVVSFLTREEEAQLGVITRQLGVSIRPDAELALKLMEEREGEGEGEGEV